VPKKKSKPKTTPATSLKGVTVRMYNGGFGDTFLLTFTDTEGKPRYLLIDCGVHDKDPNGASRMKLVAKNIADITGNRLNVVAVTHQHSDHLWGFKYGEEFFKKMKFDELWLPWTEDPSNEVARELDRLYGMKIAALQTAIGRLKAAGSPLAARLENIIALDVPLQGALRLKGNTEILEFLRNQSDKVPEKPEDYKMPSDPPIELPKVKGVKIYVLGPPMNVASIRNVDSTKETYLGFGGMRTASDFAAAVFATDKDAAKAYGWALSPFDKAYGMSKDEAMASPVYGKFFGDYYGVEGAPKTSPAWRRIDDDWLALAGELALSINEKTNNTSLVLAVELSETTSRKVLLFAADAQVGNWLSWQKLEWQVSDDIGNPEKKRKVTGPDLLNRTVFYKVGHHGSRNATLKEKGLEMMQSSELVAFISVDEKFSKSQGWGHPEKPVVDRLNVKARGRVIRSDKIPAAAPPEKPENISAAEWKAFLANLSWDKTTDKLWIEYKIQ
jgi:hypothetical protein